MEIWNLRFITRWRVRCKYYLREFKEDTQFVMRMADQRKVQPLGLIRNLKIDLANYDYKISRTILNMENGIEAYSMLSGKTMVKTSERAS
jgi:hypothetical protein